jgi:hypothetical protein
MKSQSVEEAFKEVHHHQNAKSGLEEYREAYHYRDEAARLHAADDRHLKEDLPLAKSLPWPAESGPKTAPTVSGRRRYSKSTQARTQ